MKLIIQIPCYNEADTLKTALNGLPVTLEGVDQIEYLIVDDGSTDGTAEAAREWGVDHVVRFPKNRGLAKAFMAGLDGCLRCGADIIVNTDADNQYCGADIGALIRPILEGRADMVVGARPIDETEEFSWLKKKLQHFGSWAVRMASRTDIPDAPSGFRAFSREAAMRLYVVNDYTYTLETIVQAGREKIAVTSVPVRTNPRLRDSRLYTSVWAYVKKSMLTILRAYMMYKPLMCFTLLSVPCLAVGIGIGLRFLYFRATGDTGGHVQSLILACTLIIIGFLTFMIGLVGDVISANRKIMQDVRYHVKRLEYADTLPPAGREALRTGERKPQEKRAETEGTKTAWIT